MKNFFAFTFILFLFSSASIVAQDIVSPKPEKNVPITVSQSLFLNFLKRSLFGLPNIKEDTATNLFMKQDSFLTIVIRQPFIIEMEI